MSQNLVDHVAILTSSALAVPQRNKLKPAKAPEFYAVIAFPPAAGAALHALCVTAAQAAFGGLGNDVSIRVAPNSATKKPVPGIPADWLIVRASTQFAPFVADANGVQLVQETPEGAGKIRATFYAGKRVRAALSAYGWNHTTGGKGISFNIDGIMAVEDGERLAIGNGAMVNAFAGFAKPAAAGAAGTPAYPFGNASSGGSGPANGAGFFAGSFDKGGNGARVDPFAQPVQANQGGNGAVNPFAQAA